MPEWTKDKVIFRIRELKIQLKNPPSKRIEPNLYYYARKFFGTWNNALKEAGFEIKELQKVSFPELTPLFSYFAGLFITDGNLYL
ncbi:MAG: hypothetical protein QME12_06875 [Nanoarchaeota archaeon]|nr:hypothetical protein [Nanoarchaeota archaeon]